MDLNRAPFDFAECESELVSGFNVEYSSVGFAGLFLGEYGNLLLFSCLKILFYFWGFFLFILCCLLLFFLAGCFLGSVLIS